LAVWLHGKALSVGVTYLAARLLKDGFDNVKVVDLNLEICEPENVFRKSLAIVERTNPGIIGLTCWTVQLPFCIDFVIAFKKKHPGVTVVLGGVHASSQPDELMRLCPVDVIARGEGGKDHR